MLLLLAVFVAAGIRMGLGVANAKRSRSQKTVSGVSASSHHILNDSSLAALGINDGDRTVIFQDQVGIVRQATYSDMANKWGMAPSAVVASGPKNSTPLALIHNPSTTNDTVILIHCWYRPWYWG